MNHPRVLCAAAILMTLWGAACEDGDNDIDDERVTAPTRPTGTGGGSGMSTNTAGSGTGTGSSSTNVPAGTSGSSGAAGAGTSGNQTSTGTAGASAGGAAGASGAALGIPDAGVGLDAGLPPLPADAGAAQLSDGQIITVVDTLNAGEVEQAQVALPRLTDEGLRAFANDMVTEHGAARQQLQAFAQAQGITPTNSELATTLAARSTAAVNALTGATAESVDQLYLGLQIGAHAEALLVLDQLIDAADQQPLEAQLITLRGSVDAHLNRARELNER